MKTARVGRLDLSSPMGRASWSSSPTEPAAGMPETDTVRFSGSVLPKDMDAAIRHLDDQQLDRLVTAALEERGRRKSRQWPNKVSGNDIPKPCSIPRGWITRNARSRY